MIPRLPVLCVPNHLKSGKLSENVWKYTVYRYVPPFTLLFDMLNYISKPRTCLTSVIWKSNISLGTDYIRVKPRLQIPLFYIFIVFKGIFYSYRSLFKRLINPGFETVEWLGIMKQGFEKLDFRHWNIILKAISWSSKGCLDFLTTPDQIGIFASILLLWNN